MDFTQLLKLPRRGIPQLDAFSQARRLWRRVRARPDAARIEGAFAVLRDLKLPKAVRRAFLQAFVGSAEAVVAARGMSEETAALLLAADDDLGLTFGEIYPEHVSPSPRDDRKVDLSERLEQAVSADDGAEYVLLKRMAGASVTRAEFVRLLRDKGPDCPVVAAILSDGGLLADMSPAAQLVLAFAALSPEVAERVVTDLERARPGLVAGLAGTFALAVLRQVLADRFLSSPLSVFRARARAAGNLLARHGCGPEVADAFGFVAADFLPDDGWLRTGPKYLVIDLSGGPSAALHPVSGLDDAPAGGWSDLYKTSRLVLRRVEPGSFTTGTGASARTVVLTHSYYLGVFPLTTAQVELLGGQNFSEDGEPPFVVPRAATTPGDVGCHNGLRRNDWPRDASAGRRSLIGRLRARTGLMGLDLPTDAQWEFAARAGAASLPGAGGRPCADFEELGWFEENARGRLHPVGQKRPNPWGFHDLLGNVPECCLDAAPENEPGHSRAEPEPDGPSVDPVGPWGEYRVLRGGGCFESFESSCAQGFRSSNGADWSYADMGGRIALTVPREDEHA